MWQALKFTMNTTNEKIDNFARREKLKNIFIVSFLIVTVAAISGYIFISHDPNDWSNQEVFAEIVSFRAVESQWGHRYSVQVLLENGEMAKVSIERISEIKKGRKVLLNKTVNLDSGRATYSFIRGLD